MLRTTLLAALTVTALRAWAGPSESAVGIKTFQYSPDTVRVARAVRVRWTNQDDVEHTISSGTPERRDARIATGTLSAKGTAHAAVFDAPGTYPYFCDRHQFMRGVVIVTTQGDPK